MHKNITILLSVIICSSVHTASNPAELLQKLKEEVETRELSKKASYVADVGCNGVKGVGFGFIANVCTFGNYGSYALYRAAKMLDERALLKASDAEQFGSRSRKELEKETASREVANRIGKVVGSQCGNLLLVCVLLGMVSEIVHPRH